MDDAPQATVEDLDVSEAPVAPDAPTQAVSAARPCGLSDPLPVFVCHVLDLHGSALRREIEIARSSGITVDGVHRMRTVCRRIRATLRTFRDMLPRDATAALAREYAWFAGELGRVRDLDVQRAGLQASIDSAEEQLGLDLAPYLAELSRNHADACAALAEVLRGERVAQLERGHEALLAHEPSPARLRRWTRPDLRHGAAAYADTALRRVRKLGRRSGRKAPPMHLHKLRIRCKRLRYLLESFEPYFDGELPRTIQRVRRLQETLGEIQDANVAVERIVAHLDASKGDAGATQRRSALIALQRTQELRAEHARRRFRKAWRRFDEQVSARKLRRMLG